MRCAPNSQKIGLKFNNMDKISIDNVRLKLEMSALNFQI